MNLYRAIVSLIRALSRLVNAKAAQMERPDPKPSLEAIIRALSRLINARAAVLEAPPPKPSLEAVPTLPDELQGLLDAARQSAQIRSRLPEDLRSMLDQEDEEWTTR